MKFSCTQSSLIKAINAVNKAVSLKTTIPALKGILLTVKENKLYLLASDLDLTIETSLELTESKEGSILVSAKLFEEIIRKLPNSLIVAEEENNKLNISCLGSNFSMILMDVSEYPSTGKVNQLNKITIQKDIFTDLIKKVCFAASNDDKKGVFVGCLLNFNNKILEIVALDGYRIAAAKSEITENIDKKIIIPAKILTEINKVLVESLNNQIDLIIDEKKVEFICGEIKIISRLLEGQFIKYNNALPKNFNTKIYVNKNELNSAIERASLISKEGKNLIKITVKENMMEISSRSDEGSVNEMVNVEKEGEDITIGFNGRFLVDIFKAVPDEEILFEMVNNITGVVIKSVGADEFTYLVLPVRIID